MDRNDFIEKILGGIFAVVSITAAIVEVFVNGISSTTVIAGIKDIFGTLAIVVLFLAFVKDRIPKRKFGDKLLFALNEWVKNNANMIVRKPENDTEEYFSLDMKTNVADFYDNGSHKNTGLFVRIPSIKNDNYSKNVEIDFFMNKGTFFADIPQEEIKAANYKLLGDRFCGLVKGKNSIVERATTEATNKNGVVHIILNKGIRNKKDIDDLIDVINTMYTAYLVSARIKNR